MSMVTIHIDGQPVQAESGGSLLLALLAAGHAVPHPCFHPSLSAPASCRLCLAEVETDEGRQLITTCNRSVEPGQRLHLASDSVQAARQDLAADLLLRHPADCHICERTGECDVQELVHAHAGESHQQPVPERTPRVQLGSRLVLDRDRCVLCTRCVRFEDEVSGRHTLSVQGRAADAHIVAVEPVEHELAGNLVDLCPAGALTMPDERLQPRAWRQTGISSVCPGCASGCGTRVDVADGQVQRIKPRADGSHNQGYWLCDLGRFGWQRPVERLDGPHQAGELVPWDLALATVAESMERAKQPAVLLSPFLTCEELFLLINLARRWEATLYSWQYEDPQGDQVFPSGFTLSAQRAPNVAGIQAVAAALQEQIADQASLADDLASRRIDVLYAVGGSPLGESPRLDPPAETQLIAHDICLSPMTEEAALLLAGGHAWTEKEGTFLDGHGRLQRTRAAVLPPHEARTDFWILNALWHGGPNRDTPENVFTRLSRAAEESPFASTSHASLDGLAQPVRGVAYGGGWADELQRQGLVPVEDVSKQR